GHLLVGGLGGVFRRWIHVKWNVRVGGVPFAVEDIGVQAISAGLGRRFESNFTPLRIVDQSRQFPRFGLNITADLMFLAFFHDIPEIGERILVGVAGLH